MSKLCNRQAILASLIFLVGCGSESGSHGSSIPRGYAAPSSTENLPLVSHPEYVAWSRFPVGMAVVRKKEVTNEFGVVRVTTTLRMAEKTTDHIVVESQVTVYRNADPPEENPPLKFDFPAKFRLPQGMQLEQFALPALKAEQVGEETRRVCDRECSTQLFAWEEVNKEATMAIKLWRSDDIPGRMVRQEVKGPSHNSVEDVVEIIQPAGETGRGT